jgi:hypothetical protein
VGLNTDIISFVEKRRRRISVEKLFKHMEMKASRDYNLVLLESEQKESTDIW